MEMDTTRDKDGDGERDNSMKIETEEVKDTRVSWRQAVRERNSEMPVKTKIDFN